MVRAKISLPPSPRLFWPGPIRPDPVTDENRIIGESQIYDLDLVKELVKLHGVVVLNDDTVDGMKGEGRNPLPPPAWKTEDIVGVILSLTVDDFENAQWCKTNNNTYLDCDSYLIYYGRSKMARWDTPTAKGLKLYVKFGFNPNLTVPRAVVCRLHPANY